MKHNGISQKTLLCSLALLLMFSMEARGIPLEACHCLALIEGQKENNRRERR